MAISKDNLKKTEAIFKKQERAREGTEAMLEYEALGRAVREKTARLRALRLAAEASNTAKAAAKQSKGSVKKVALKAADAAQP